jgi:hypothetical protein
MFPIGLPQVYGRPVSRIECGEDGTEILVKESPSVLFSPYIEKWEIIRLSKDDMKKSEHIKSKKTIDLFLNNIIRTSWSIVIKIIAIIITVVLFVWLPINYIDNLELRDDIIASLILGFLMLLIVLSTIAEVWCDLPYFKCRDREIKKEAKLTLQEILNRNGLSDIDPDKIGLTHILMPHEPKLPPQ